ncbi:MAG: FAD-binding protein, partial [Gemmatimonadota bacterium]|nr:FAD-binding protein [Gemmatimonadota bacterium]
PRSAQDVVRSVELAAEAGVPITARGAGTSMSGQSIGSGLVLDTSLGLNGIREFDPEARRVVVEPGIVLDELNRYLAPHGLFFPIDVATSSRATIGGMAGNNSAGARSIRYGHMVEQVLGIEAVLPDGSLAWFGPTPDPRNRTTTAPAAATALHTALQAIYARESEELVRRLPDVPRHVAGYALQRLGRPDGTLADLLVGSEGTLAIFTAVELRLHPVPATRGLAVCRFPDIRAALAAVPAIVELEPTAVELVDRTLLELASEIPAFRSTLGRIVGDEREDPRVPGGILLVEFAGEDPEAVGGRLAAILDVARGEGADGAYVARDPGLQAEIWELRKAGLNIATSMREPRKPIAFIEDCTIPLDRLPEWYDRLSSVIATHETTAIWYAHASVGCLHVRPALDLREPLDIRRLRALATEAFAIARELGGSHSGEHGDGIVRSEFIEPMLGSRLAAAFEDVKTCFDPTGLLNPGKIVRPPRMDDRGLFRYSPDYQPSEPETALDWSEWGGLVGAVEMCNNNGACRQAAPGVMCPSYRATREEQHSTRGRANALRLVMAGQLGDPERAWESDELHDAMDLCIGCKACRRECPTGVDMARMKIEYLYRQNATHGLARRDRALASLPRLARWISRVPTFANMRNHAGPFAALIDGTLELASDRPLPRWAPRPFAPPRKQREAAAHDPATAARKGRRVVVFVDTFTRYFEPENAYAAARVLQAAGYSVQYAERPGRPVCCGRTYLNAGLVEEARAEMDRLVQVLLPFADRGIPIIGLEPSCLLTLRDELLAVRPGDAADRIAVHGWLFSEFIAEECLDRLTFENQDERTSQALVHGHCHEKAFGAAESTLQALGAVPGLEAAAIPAGCCGMAGSFGYEAEHAELSRTIGELDLAPAIREAAETTCLIANGTSCRHQIRDLTGRDAVHLAVALDRALAE